MAPKLTPSRILIVDDLQANRISLIQVLKDLDVDIYEAKSGNEALVMVLKYRFSVIMIDVSLPIMNGYETASLIHNNSHYKHIPIVMVTAGDSTKDSYLQAYEAGAVDCVAKPIKPVILLNKIKQFVELDRQRRIAINAQQESIKFGSRLKVLLEAAGEGIIGIDVNGLISFANPKACLLLGIKAQHILKLPILNFINIDITNNTNKNTIKIIEKHPHQKYLNPIELLIQQYKGAQQHGEWLNADGESFHSQFTCEPTFDETLKYNGAVIIFQDVSDKKAMENKLRFLASFDPLTELANRAYFQDALDKAIARSKRSGKLLGLLFLDLDHFKYINDNLGHDAGDLLLKYVAKIIKASVRQGDVVSRMGGDEFAIILHDLRKVHHAGIIATSLLDYISQPFYIAGNKIDTSISIGISILDEHINDANKLVKSADTAMYAAKKQGRNKFQYFEKEMQKEAERNTRIQVALQKSISNNELILYYQPKVSYSQQKIVGCEALLRWSPNKNSIISPTEFIPIAENSGQIIDIGKWVLASACEQIDDWQKTAKLSDLVLSVNVSASQLTTGDFKKMVQDILEDNKIDPGLLEIELTETGVMHNPAKAKQVLDNIHAMGVTISIDDFGTGYSSLDHLRRLPIDIIKIDRCFVNGINTNRQDEEIILAVLAIAEVLNIDVIAEGVETREQLDFLVAANCDLFQGYYFSKPVNSEDLQRIIMQNAYMSGHSIQHG